MFRRARLAVALAVVASGVAASSAAALDMTIDPAGRVVTASNGKLTFGEAVSIQCNVTLKATLAATSIAVTSGAHVGEVSEVSIRNCEGGSVSGVLGLPWEITIDAPLETEPEAEPRNLTGMLFELRDVAFNLSIFGGFVNCLYRGDTAGLAELIPTGEGETTYTANAIASLGEVFVPFERGSGFCPEDGAFTGEFTVNPEQTYAFS
jgi:hypothetical protein